jgi:lipoprotein signal peptidase
MSERSFRGLLWGLALLGLLLDQGSKYLVFHQLYNHGEGDRRPLIPGAFDLLTQFTPKQADPGNPFYALQAGERLPHVNPGALFGIQIGMGVSANTVFALISLLAAAAIIYWSSHRSLARDPTLCAALGLILGGTLGNLYDRVVFHGVRDFLYWYYKIDWPVFNIADCCLVCGAALLLMQAFFAKHEPAPAPAAEAVSQQPAESPAC